LRAHRLIEGSAYAAETLAVLGEGFDQAWAEIAHLFANEELERARMRLAHAVLIVADDNSRDAVRVKQEALRVLSITYASRLPNAVFT
jgi:hypothetical protein